MGQRTRNNVTRFCFLPFARNISKKYGKQLLDTATKTGLAALKSSSKKEVHKEAESTGESNSLTSKIADKIVKPKLLLAENSRNIEEILTREKTRNTKQIKASIIK